jgi:DNA polymerase-3 subunit gamma/tau
LVEEKDETELPADRPLNTKEQFLKIAEEYPLVKELRDRLKLDLDF